jgi:hypothetical protein
VPDTLIKKLDQEASQHRLSRTEFLKLLVENCSECYDIIATKKLETSAKMVELENAAADWMREEVTPTMATPEMLFVLGGIWHRIGNDMMNLAKDRFDINDMRKVEEVVEKLDKEVNKS